MSDTTKIAGQAQTCTYQLRDASNNLVTPTTQPQVSIYSDAGRTTLVSGPTAVTGSGGDYTWTYPTGLAIGTYYLKFTYNLASGPVTDNDDRLILVAVIGSVSSALATLDEFKQAINYKTTSTTTDAELQRFLDAATPVVEFITGPVLPRSVVERRDGGGDTVMLRTRPLVSVTSVVEYRGTTTTSLTEAATPAAAGTNTFTVNTDTGAITRRTSGGGITTFPAGVDNVVITYSAGLASVPSNVKNAALEQAKHMFQKSQLGGRPQLAAGGVADYTNGWGYGIPNAVREYLEPNRRLPGLA